MKKILVGVVLLCSMAIQGQEKESVFIDANYFYGSILRHNKDIEHLIKGHPKGFILGYNVKTFGKSRWQQAYNYPDFGVSMVYQNPQNDVLGSTISIHGHYNFYFLKKYPKNMMFGGMAGGPRRSSSGTRARAWRCAKLGKCENHFWFVEVFLLV